MIKLVLLVCNEFKVLNLLPETIGGTRCLRRELAIF
jgi:hypothetical protein